MGLDSGSSIPLSPRTPEDGIELLEELLSAREIARQELRDRSGVQRKRILRNEGHGVVSLLQGFVAAAVVKVEVDQMSMSLAEIGLELQSPP